MCKQSQEKKDSDIIRPSQDLSQLSLRSDETAHSQEHSAQQKGNFSVTAKYISPPPVKVHLATTHSAHIFEISSSN